MQFLRSRFVDLRPSPTNLKNKLNLLAEELGIRLDVGVHDVAAQGGVKAREVDCRFSTVFHVERLFHLLKDEERVLQILGALFDIAIRYCGNRCPEIADQQVVEHDDQPNGRCILHRRAEVCEFSAISSH